MTNDEAKKMLKAKLECLKHETSGTDYACNQHLCEGCSLNYEQGNMGEQKEALDMAIKALEQTRWIPVSEKMPPIAQRVLVSATNGEVFIARYHSFDKWTFEPTGISYAYKKDSIVAWMPLPESYKIPAQTFGCAED